MKTWKLVAGILSIVLFVVVTFQSCAVGTANTLTDSNDTSGTSGIFVAIMMLSGGIVSIATRKAQGKGGNIALIILFGLAALIGYSENGIFEDLIVWASWCLINAVLALVSLIKKEKQ